MCITYNWSLSADADLSCEHERNGIVLKSLKQCKKFGWRGWTTLLQCVTNFLYNLAVELPAIWSMTKFLEDVGVW